MSATPPTITVSIVSHGHGELVAHLLHDLQALAGGASSSSITRVLLTLNLGAQEAFNPQQFPGLAIEVIRNESPKGFGANHNAAFARCTTEWFAVLNPDLRLMNGGDPFAALLAAAAQAPELALMAPQVINPQGGLEDAVRANLTLPSLLRRARGHRQALAVSGPAQAGRSPFYWMAGMFMLVRSDSYRQLGGFDERFFMYCEDYDLCARLYLAGHALQSCRTASVVHDARRASRRSWSHLRWHLGSLARVWLSAPFWRLVFGRHPH